MTSSSSKLQQLKSTNRSANRRQQARLHQEITARWGREAAAAFVTLNMGGVKGYGIVTPTITCHCEKWPLPEPPADDTESVADSSTPPAYAGAGVAEDVQGRLSIGAWRGPRLLKRARHPQSKARQHHRLRKVRTQVVSCLGVALFRGEVVEPSGFLLVPE